MTSPGVAPARGRGSPVGVNVGRRGAKERRAGLRSSGRCARRPWNGRSDGATRACERGPSAQLMLIDAHDAGCTTPTTAHTPRRRAVARPFHGRRAHRPDERKPARAPSLRDAHVHADWGTAPPGRRPRGTRHPRRGRSVRRRSPLSRDGPAPRSTTVRFDDLGHSWMVEDPQLVATALQDFWSSLR